MTNYTLSNAFNDLIGKKLIKVDFTPEGNLKIQHEKREGVEHTITIRYASLESASSRHITKFPVLVTDPRARTIGSITTRDESTHVQRVGFAGEAYLEEKSSAVVEFLNLSGEKMVSARWNSTEEDCSAKPVFTTF
jgi:hypothetical protein